MLASEGLRVDAGGWEAFGTAIMTTDSRRKAATTTIALPTDDLSLRLVRVSGVAKGVGMIHPRMATMIAVVLTDAAASPELLATLLREASAATFEQTSVDGDTSTNDTVFVLASGASTMVVLPVYLDASYVLLTLAIARTGAGRAGRPEPGGGTAECRGRVHHHRTGPPGRHLARRGQPARLGAARGRPASPPAVRAARCCTCSRRSARNCCRPVNRVEPGTAPL